MTYHRNPVLLVTLFSLTLSLFTIACAQKKEEPKPVVQATAPVAPAPQAPAALPPPPAPAPQLLQAPPPPVPQAVAPAPAPQVPDPMATAPQVPPAAPPAMAPPPPAVAPEIPQAPIPSAPQTSAPIPPAGQPVAPSAVPPPPAVPLAPAAPTGGGALAKADHETPGIRAEVTELKRGSGGTVMLKFSIYNDSDNPMSFNYNFGAPEHSTGDFNSIAGVNLIDIEGKKKYLVVRDAANSCVCSKGLKDIPPKSSTNLWAKFPAPPDNVEKISIVIPHFSPIDDVALSR